MSSVRSSSFPVHTVCRVQLFIIKGYFLSISMVLRAFTLQLSTTFFLELSSGAIDIDLYCVIFFGVIHSAREGQSLVGLDRSRRAVLGAKSQFKGNSREQSLIHIF